MAQHEVRAALILRNDTSINWTVKNPILLKGETGVEIDTGLVKVGDGISTWQNLNYINEKVNLTNYVEKPVMTASGNLIAATINGELVDTPNIGAKTETTVCKVRMIYCKCRVKPKPHFAKCI